MKFLKENMEETFQDIGRGNSFVDRMQKLKETKQKMTNGSTSN
jgi:hypothetical protein